MLQSGGIPGELDHPIDRSETCSEKIAIMMPEAPKKDDKGHLVARFDIIDTPMGRIAAALAKYGFKFGISSRGTGDTYTDYDGNESVDPDSYDFQAFDLVLLPACKDARLKLAESFDTRGVHLRRALNEAIESADDSQKKAIIDTLNNLDIDYSDKRIIDNNSEDNALAATDDGASILQELTTALNTNKVLDRQVRDLQEKLSVCHTKESESQETIRTVKRHAVEQAKLNESLNKRVETLSTELSESKSMNESLNGKISVMRGYMDRAKEKVGSLQESLTSSQQKVKELTSLNESYSKKISSMEEEIMELGKDSKIQAGIAKNKIDSNTRLVEKYKKIAQMAVEKYISCQASRCGVDENLVKRSLTENYSFSDIDAACERLQKVNLDVGALPFADPRFSHKVKMTLKESAPAKNQMSQDTISIDDDVDDVLLNIVK